ncbi:hypothetical protein TRAPUB_3534 [Trametes pubescens]|uniref:Uncharacterized protein n=1 Tax=Trametes pubescens TaxID=154538 RepID=A0A1M2VD83_TRAPU|nr:hypothetical protein TRAPUB_3534 [Trametes pubescens]
MPVLQDATSQVVNSQSPGEQPVHPQEIAIPPTPAAQGPPNTRKRAQPDADAVGRPQQKQARQGAQKTTSSRNTRRKKTPATAATVGTAVQVGVGPSTPALGTIGVPRPSPPSEPSGIPPACPTSALSPPGPLPLPFSSSRPSSIGAPSGPPSSGVWNIPPTDQPEASSSGMPSTPYSATCSLSEARQVTPFAFPVPLPPPTSSTSSVASPSLYQVGGSSSIAAASPVCVSRPPSVATGSATGAPPDLSSASPSVTTAAAPPPPSTPLDTTQTAGLEAQQAAPPARVGELASTVISAYQSVHRALSRRSNAESPAKDAWFFVRALDTDDEPAVMPDTTKEPTLTRKPPTPHVGCKICTKKWQTWKNGDGVVSNIRCHLRKKHGDLYAGICTQMGWSPRGDDDSGTSTEHPEFTKEGFLERLLKLVVTCNLAINIIEHQEFHDLILLNTELDDDDIPHRTYLTEQILLRFRDVYQELIKQLQVRVSPVIPRPQFNESTF